MHQELDLHKLFSVHTKNARKHMPGKPRKELLKTLQWMLKKQIKVKPIVIAMHTTVVFAAKVHWMISKK